MNQNNKLSERYIKLIYKFWATIYDNYVDRRFRFNRKKVVNHLQLKKNQKVMEIGVGTGLNLPHYPPFCNVMGVDFSLAMLKRAKRKKTNAKVSLQIADARKLPFSVNTFDKALTTYVLRVSPEPKKILKEASRVVKKNGLFVVLDQFKGKHKIILALLQPIKLLLGWGKEYDLDKLLQGTSWKIIHNKKMGRKNNTRLIT